MAKNLRNYMQKTPVAFFHLGLQSRIIRVVFGILITIFLILFLSSCFLLTPAPPISTETFSPTPPTPSQTPFPTFNLTPSNNDEATLFPIIATSTANVHELILSATARYQVIQQTLAPHVATARVSVDNEFATATSRATILQSTLQPAIETATARVPTSIFLKDSGGFFSVNSTMNFLLWGSFWLLPSVAIAIFCWQTAKGKYSLNEKAFSAFLIAPNFLIQSFTGSKATTRSEDGSILEFEDWSPAKQMETFILVTLFGAVWISFLFIFSSLKEIIFTSFWALLLIQILVFLFLIPIFHLLLTAASLIGWSSVDLLRTLKRKTPVDGGQIADIWIAIFLTWGIGFIPILLGLLAPLPPSTKTTLLIVGLVYLLFLWSRFSIAIKGGAWLAPLITPIIAWKKISQKIIDFWQMTYQYRTDRPVDVYLPQNQFRLIAMITVIGISICVSTRTFPLTILENYTGSGFLEHPSARNVWWLNSILEFKDHFVPYQYLFENPAFFDKSLMNTPTRDIIAVFSRESVSWLEDLVDLDISLGKVILITPAIFLPLALYLLPIALFEVSTAFLRGKVRLETASSSRSLFTNRIIVHLIVSLYALFFWQAILMSSFEAASIPIGQIHLFIYALFIYYAVGYMIIGIKKDFAIGIGWRWLLVPINFIQELLLKPFQRVTLAIISVSVIFIPVLSLILVLLVTYFPDGLRLFPLLSDFTNRLVLLKEGVWLLKILSIKFINILSLLVIFTWTGLAVYSFSHLRTKKSFDISTSMSISAYLCFNSILFGLLLAAFFTVLLTVLSPILPDTEPITWLISIVSSLAILIFFLIESKEFLKIQLGSVPRFLISPLSLMYALLFVPAAHRNLNHGIPSATINPWTLGSPSEQYSNGLYPSLATALYTRLKMLIRDLYLPDQHIRKVRSSLLFEPIGSGLVLLQGFAYLFTDLILSSMLSTRIFGLYIPLSSSLPSYIFGNGLLLILHTMYVGFILSFLTLHIASPGKRSLFSLYDTFFHQVFSLIFSFAVVHLYLLPINLIIYQLTKSQSNFEIYKLLYFAIQSILVFAVYTHLNWNVYKDRFLPVLSDLRTSLNSFLTKSRKKLNLFFWFIRSLLRSVLFPVNMSIVSSSGWLWFSVILYIVGFTIAAILLLIKQAVNPSNLDPTNILFDWLSRTVVMLSGVPFLGLLALHPVHVFFFSATNNVQYYLGKLLKLLEGSNRVTLLSFPIRLVRNILIARWTLYPGFRQIIIHLAITILLINGFLGFVIHPLEIFLGDLILPSVSWKNLEIVLTLTMASLFAANFVRAIPFAILLGGLFWSSLVVSVPDQVGLLIHFLFLVVLGIFLLKPFLDGYILNNSRGQKTGFIVSLKLLSSQVLSLRYFGELLDNRYRIFESSLGVDRFLLTYEPQDNAPVKDAFFRTLRLIDQTETVWQPPSPDIIVQMLRLILRKMPQLGTELLELIIFTPEKLTLSTSIIRECQQAAVKTQLMEANFSWDEEIRILLQLRRLGIFKIEDNSSQMNSIPYYLSAAKGIPSISSDKERKPDWYDDLASGFFETYTSFELDVDGIHYYWQLLRDEIPQAAEALRIYTALIALRNVQSVEEIAALNYTSSNFQIDLNYMDDLSVGLSELANVSENLTRAETLGGRRDQLDVYRAADFRLRKSLEEIDETAFDPEKQILKSIVQHWLNILSTHIQNLTPTADLAASLAATEIIWVPSDRIALIIKNSADGPAFDLKIRILPGDGYKVIDPADQDGIVSIESIQSSGEVKIEFEVEFLRKDFVEIIFEVFYTDSTLNSKRFMDKQILRFQQATDLGFPDVLNPYQIGTPVENPQLFVGRDDIFEIIEKTLMPDGRASIILMYGQRRTGKTSIIKQLIRRYKDSSTFWPIFLDLQVINLYDPKGDAQRFFAWMINEIKAGMSDFPGGEKVKTYTGINNEQHDYFSILRYEFLPQVDDLLASKEKSLLLLFDEFDTLRQFFDFNIIENILWNLRGLVFQRPRGGVILIGTPTLKEMALSTKQTPFFGSISKIIQVGPLDDSAARTLIQKPVEKVLDYSPNAVEKILKLSGNNPQIIQTICLEIFKLARERSQRAVGLGMVEDAIKEALNQFTAQLGWWNEFSREEKAVVSALAHILNDETTFASAPKITREISSYGIKVDGITFDLGTVQNSLERLEAWQMIDKQADLYKFSIDLFRRWVKNRKPPGIVKSEIS